MANDSAIASCRHRHGRTWILLRKLDILFLVVTYLLRTVGPQDAESACGAARTQGQTSSRPVLQHALGGRYITREARIDGCGLVQGSPKALEGCFQHVVGVAPGHLVQMQRYPGVADHGLEELSC